MAELRQGAKPPAVRIATFLGLLMVGLDLMVKKQTKIVGEIAPFNNAAATGASRRFPGAG